MLFDLLDVEERLPSQEGRRAASRRVVNWVVEGEDRMLVVLAFSNQRRIGHRSPLINHRYVKEA